jgi:hypothetical protein
MMRNPGNQRPEERGSTVVTGKRAGVMWEDINSIYLDTLCTVIIQYEHFITQDNLRRVQIQVMLQCWLQSGSGI